MSPMLKRRLRTFLVVFLIIGVILASGALLSRDEESQQPYDPDSADPTGTKALSMLVERLGGDFSQSAEAPREGTALLVADTLTRSETLRVENWIASGGTLVVADLASSFAARVQVTQPTRAPVDLQPRCDLPYAEGVQRIRPEPSGFYSTLEPARDAVSQSLGCFPVESGFYLLEQRQGLGRVVVVGGPEIFTNNYLADADNAVLVANLLDVEDGQDVVFLETRGEVAGGEGDSSLWSLIPDRTESLLFQLLIASLVLVAWRWRRFGKPVREEQPVEIPASSLVEAVGDLMHAGHREDRAAAILRHDLRRLLNERFGLPPNTSTEVLAEVTSRHTGIHVDAVRDALIDKPSDSEGLVELAQRVEQIRQNV